MYFALYDINIPHALTIVKSLHISGRSDHKGLAGGSQCRKSVVSFSSKGDFYTPCPQLNLPIEGQSINLLPPVKVWPESLINQGVNRLSCRHIIPCAGESGACAFYPRPVWPRSGRRQNNTPGWWLEDTASRIPGIFSGVGKYRFPSVSPPVPVQPAALTAQNTGKGSRSTIYEAYSKSSPGEGRAFPARHSWRISLLPAFGSLHARSGSAPAAGRSFLPSPLLRKLQLEIHILFARIIQHHHGIIGFAGFFTEKPGHGNAALL